MKTAHTATIRVFCSQEENEEEAVNGLRRLVPIDFEEEKIRIRKQAALGFNDKKIAIFEVALTKDRHAKAFLDGLMQKVSEHDKQLLLRQLESRVDNEGNFFVRLEKERLAKHNDLVVTDGGNCYHVRIKVAVFPSTKKAAMAAMEKILA